jgi:hypothetical protein
MNDEIQNDGELLRATSDRLIVAINEVGAKERQKRGVRPADPRFPELARDVRIAAQAVLQFARLEEAAAAETAAEPDVETLPAINKIPPGRELALHLERWRAVEQALDAADPGSPEAKRLLGEFQRLRDQYNHAVEDKLRDR